MFVDYQTTRDQAHLIGQKASHGCSYADSWASVPFQRMPNVSLEPGEKDLSEQDIIAATDDGIYVKGDASYSIDQQRYNFQFSGQTFWEVKNGKITTQLRDVAYQSNTPEFWKSCDMVGGKSTYALGGAFSDGKGQPMQINSVSHGCADHALRARQHPQYRDAERSSARGHRCSRQRRATRRITIED